MKELEKIVNSIENSFLKIEKEMTIISDKMDTLIESLDKLNGKETNDKAV